jgi:hypothetical protein
MTIELANEHKSRATGAPIDHKCDGIRGACRPDVTAEWTAS